MRFEFSKEVYTRSSILKTSYNYSDEYYIHIDVNDKYYIILLTPKNGNSVLKQEEFQNEVLVYTLRENIQENTKEIRELIMARAFASTIIDNNIESAHNECNVNIDGVLTDWFEKYE